MKTRTFKILVAALILMQLSVIGTLALSMRRTAVDEQSIMTKLLLDMDQLHVTLAEYELAVAAQGEIDKSTYDNVYNAISDDLDQLQKLNGDGERGNILAKQRELLNTTVQVVDLLRDTVNQREHADRFAILITMLKGSRRLARTAHSLHDGMSALVETMPAQQEGPSPLILAALALSGVSTVVAVVLFAKGSSAMSY